ncbi:Wzz/FepE/Etk N-terminal domain-containing protein, partial [Listeria monocytogenes]|uniref:Wzz/FepE/Etk N-terminal domain-containing protein n=1 Tax=Listeria monocytogenes TaxID=1639 RepID=UPI002FDC0ECB
MTGELADTPTLLRLLRRSWLLVVAGLALGLAVAACVALLSSTTYTASAYVVVVPDRGGDAAGATQFGQVFARIAV